jgi:hypothetical protein
MKNKIVKTFEKHTENLNISDVSDSDDIQKMSLPKRFVKGFTFGTLVIDQKYYMRYMTNELYKMGIKFEQKKVNNLEELYNKNYDAIINCTGLGSYTLINDTSMYPIRGQVMRVKAPWMNNIWFFGSPTRYIIPNVDTVVLGGTVSRLFPSFNKEVIWILDASLVRIGVFTTRLISLSSLIIP